MNMPECDREDAFEPQEMDEEYLPWDCDNGLPEWGDWEDEDEGDDDD